MTPQTQPRHEAHTILPQSSTAAKRHRSSGAGYALGVVATTCFVVWANTDHRDQLALICVLIGALGLLTLARRSSAVGVVLGVLTVFLVIALAFVAFAVWIMQSGASFG